MGSNLSPLEQANRKGKAENLSLASSDLDILENPIVTNVTEETNKLKRETERDTEDERKLKKSKRDEKLNKLQDELDRMIEFHLLNKETIYLIGLKMLAIEYHIHLGDTSKGRNKKQIIRLEKALP